MLCCVQSSETALYWAAWHGYANIVQMLVDHDAAVDLGRDEVTNLLTYRWSFGCVIHASADLVYNLILGLMRAVRPKVLCEIWAWLLT